MPQTSTSSLRVPALARGSDSAALLFEALIANLQDGVFAETDDATIIAANDAFSRLFGVPHPRALIGTSASDLREAIWRELIPDPAAYRRLTTRLRKAGRPQLAHEIQLTDGRFFCRDYVPVPLERGTIHMWHYRDITEQRKLELRVRESRRRLRDLSAHADQMREEERRVMARALHDEAGQLFSGIRLELAAAIQHFRSAPDPTMRPVVDRLQAAVGLTELGVESLRTLTMALRPPILDRLGLVPALRWAASLFTRRTGIRTYVRARPATLTMDDARTTALYRIALEALENVHRHAGAGTVWITVARHRGATALEVRDNGRGITDEEINNTDTMGLLGMRERALAHGGELRIARGARRGTLLQVMFPDARLP